MFSKTDIKCICWQIKDFDSFQHFVDFLTYNLKKNAF